MDLSPANRKKELWLRHSQATCPRKQLTFYCTTTGLPAKWHLRNEHRHSILMMHHYPDLGSTSDWLCHVGYLLQPINSTTQTWVVTCHQYGISALISQLRNVGCFFWLPNNISQRLQSGSWMLKGSIAWFQIEKGWTYELVYYGINNTRPTLSERAHWGYEKSEVWFDRANIEQDTATWKFIRDTFQKPFVLHR